MRIKGRDQKAILKRITDQMEAQGFDALMLTSGPSILYATGFAVRSLYRSGKTGNAVCVITKDGEVYLELGEFEKHAAQQACDPSIHIDAYPVWIYIEDYAVKDMTKEVQPDLNNTYRRAAQFVPEVKGGAVVGVESKWINWDAREFIHATFGKDKVKDCTKVINEARAIKTPWEIEVLRYNAKMSELAMNMTGKELVPGMTTPDVHAVFHKHCFALCPNMTTASMSHTIGADFAPAWIPVETRINRGDLVRLDGGPYTDGYKSDLARTFAVGNYASEDKIELFDRLYKGYAWGRDHIGPGVRMCDIFEGIKQVIDIPEYVRGHFGHSISCDIAGEEPPFIAPGETRVFEPGMVMCLETPFYSARRHTYNIEDTFVVTENGTEFFTHAEPTMFI